MASAPKVFISYSHKDGRWLEEFQTHLKPLMRGALIDAWADSRLVPGSNWAEEIRRAIDAADLGVLLVTAHFLASDYIAQHELPPLLAKSKVFWIAISPSNYGVMDLASKQCANDPGRPLSTLKRSARDREWVKLCQKLQEALSALAPAAAHSAHLSDPSLVAIPNPTSGTSAMPIPHGSPRTTLSAVERSSLIRTLNGLVPQQFHELLFALNPPAGVVPPMLASQGDRTFALLSWAEGPNGCGLAQVKQILEGLLNPP